MVAIFKSTARLMSDNRNSISRSDTGQRLINSIKSSIFDKLVELTVAIPIDGKLSNQNTTARFLNSSDRIMEKAHGNMIA